MEKIYSLNADLTRGTCRRTHEYWEGKLFSRNSWQAFFYRDFNKEDVLVLPGRAYAYLDWDEEKKRLTVREAQALPGDLQALAAVLYKALSLKPSLNEVIIVLPEGDPSVDDLLADFYQYRLQNSFMFYLMNPRLFLLQLGGIKGNIEKKVRLQMYTDAGWLEPVVLNLETFLPAEDGAEFDATIYIHQSTFLRMLTGLQDPASALLSDRITISGDSEGIARSLQDQFAHHAFVLWPSDRW